MSWMRSLVGTPTGTTIPSSRQSFIAAAVFIYVLPFYAWVPRLELFGPVDLNDVIPLLAVAASGLLLFEHKKVQWHPVYVGLGLFALVAFAAAAMQTANVVDAVRASARIGGRIAVYVLIIAGVRLLSIAQRRRLLAMVVWGGVGQAFLGVLMYLFQYAGPFHTGTVGQHVLGSEWLRVHGTFGGAIPPGEVVLNRANFYSAYLSVVAGILLAFWKEWSLRRWAFCGVTILLGILVSYSRMSLLAIGVAIMMFALLRRRVGLASGFVAIALVILLSVPALRARFSDIGTDRWTQWAVAVKVIESSPWWGCGDGRYLETALHLDTGVSGTLIRTPHNSVLYAAASYGVGAGLLLLAIYGLLVMVAYRLWKRSRTLESAALMAVVVSFLAHDMSNNLFFVPEVALVFWLGLAALDFFEAPRHQEA